MEDKSNLLPERAGQADVMTVAGVGSLMEPEPDAGHWYSPTAVRRICQTAIVAERERCSKEFVENGRAIGRAEEREACALACEAEHVGADVCDDCNNETDEAYNRALRDGATSIRMRPNV